MKKGFTLIELLAVIVVLAVIAIIAIPIITNVIDKAKQGALKDSAYGIIDSGELYLAKNMSKGIETTEFTCSDGKCINGEQEINYKGKIDSGKIKLYSDGKISVCVENGINSAIKLATEKKVTVKKGNCNYTGETYEIDEVVSLTKYNELKNELNELKDKGDAEASNILVNKKAVVKGLELTGTMPNYSNNTYVASNVTSDASNTYFTIPNNGYYNVGSKIMSSNSNLKIFPKSVKYVIHDIVSNSSASNIRTGQYTATGDGVISYICASANYYGSRAYATLNGVTLQDSNGPINLILGNVSVKKGDVLYLYAYGYKDVSSNSSAYIAATFGAY